MKKQLFSILAVAAALVLSLSNCSNDDPADALEVNIERTATITGTIVIQQNQQRDADGKLYYSVPQMTANDIKVTVAYTQLGYAVAGVYEVPTSNITFDTATGRYTIISPVGPSATDVVITLNDISGTQNQDTGELDANNDPIYAQVNGVWKAPLGPKTVSGIKPSQVKDEGVWILGFTKTTQNGSVAP